MYSKGNTRDGGDYAAGNPPPVGNESNTQRIYFPSDAGSAPSKPFVTQNRSYVSGPNPPVNGTTTTILVEVNIINPSAFAITFSASNLVTVNIPGSGAVYGGSATVTQGTITFQPSVGGTGNITWNPGTVSANTNETLAYLVRVTPSAVGIRIPVTGTSSSNGTTATFVDETGNTTQGRATFTFGPLCEIAVTESSTIAPTHTSISSFQTFHKNGQVVIEWQTASEVGTAGFNVYKLDESSAEYLKLNTKLLSSLLTFPQGGIYRYLDPTVFKDGSSTYKLEEIEARGKSRFFGLFKVVPYEQEVFSIYNPDVDIDLFRNDPRGFAKIAHGTGGETKDFGKILKVQSAGTQELRLQRTGDRVKVVVSKRGVYYLSAHELAAVFGILENKVKNIILSNGLSVSNFGRAIPYIPYKNNDGIFFYGEEFNANYTSENIYWIERSAGLAMKRINGGNPESAGTPGSFIETLHLEKDLVPLLSLIENPEDDFWARL